MKRYTIIGNTFICIIIIILLFLKIKSINSSEKFKILHISDDYYYIIKKNSILYFNNANSEEIEITNEISISTSDEWEMISLGIFKGLSFLVGNLLIIKNNLYAILESMICCKLQLNEINGKSEIYPYECVYEDYCYYLIGFINSEKTLYLNLYSNKYGECQSNMISTFFYNNIDSDDFSCKFMNSYTNNRVLSCFYQSGEQKDIVAQSFKISTNPTIGEIQPISSLTQFKASNGAKAIKSILSQDETQAFVCFINDNNNCDCLIYDITTNEWNDYSTYLYDCLPSSSSLNIEYFESSNEYVVYCFQSETKFFWLN